MTERLRNLVKVASGGQNSGRADQPANLEEEREKRRENKLGREPEGIASEGRGGPTPPDASQTTTRSRAVTSLAWKSIIGVAEWRLVLFKEPSGSFCKKKRLCRLRSAAFFFTTA